jgi:excisionase family DNA binding protein
MIETQKPCRTYPHAADTHKPCSVATTIERYGRMMKADELAPLLSMSPKTLYKRVKHGTMPATRIGGAVLFDPYVTAQWLRSQAA